MNIKDSKVEIFQCGNIKCASGMKELQLENEIKTNRELWIALWPTLVIIK